MTDTTQATLEAEVPAAVAQEAIDPSKVLKVPCTKGKATVDIITDKLPDAVYREALLQGLKVLINRGGTKITKAAYPKEEELRAKAMEHANQQVQNLYAGKIRIMGAKADKVSGVVMTEARRLARNLVKDEMKRQGIKVSYVEASEITKAANALIAAQPEIVEQAKASLAERDKKADEVKTKLSAITGGIQISAKKKAKVEAEKEKAKAQLSAAKAGQTATRQKPQATA